MNTKTDPTLPIGDKPFWDLKNAEEEPSLVKSVTESCVLLQSLKQSRERWLYKNFPKFSSKVRGKAAEAPPPPHTHQMRGICDVAIGPHIFPDTTFYEIQYLCQGQQSSSAPNQPPAPNTYWQASTSYASSYSQSAMAATTSQTPPVTATVPTAASVPTPLISSLNDTITLTPGLISQVNAAASANPILANLLQLAAGGKATEDQLHTLGLLIQSFANLESLSASSKAAPVVPQATVPASNYYQRPQTFPPAKEFDLVFEFRETPNDRWLFPRGPVHYTRTFKSVASGVRQDVALLTLMPFNTGKGPSNDSFMQSEGQYPVSLILKETPAALWDTIFRWIGSEEKNKANKQKIDSVVPPPRLYLGYQIPPGPIMTQIQAACAPAYAMRTLKQGPIPQQTRAPRKRQRKEVEAPSGTSRAPGDTVTVKRARAGQAKSTPNPIQCLACKKTDVPLILGGKFCRPCADIEKQKVEFIIAAPPAQTAVPPS